MTELIEAGRVQTNTRIVRDELVAADPTNIKPGGTNISRVYAPGVTPDQFKDLIDSKYKGAEVNIIDPNQEGSLSSKFKTFTFKANGQPVSIVLATGIRAGEKGEISQAGTLQEQLKQAIDQNGGRIGIDVGRRSPVVITKGDVERIPGNYLADVSIDNILYIQLKQPQFQQLSGLIKTSTYVSGDALQEINLFIEKVKEITNGVMAPATNYKRQVVSPELARVAIFGDPKAPAGINHIQLVCKGDMQLVPTKTSGIYEIKGAAGTLKATDKLTKDSEWWPLMFAKYSRKHNQKGIKNCRFNFGASNFIPNAQNV